MDSKLSDFKKSLSIKISDKKHQELSNRRDWLYTSMEINYVVLNAVDLLTTFNCMDKGAKERNPIARLFIKNKPLAVIIKGGLTGGVLYGLSYLKKEDKKAAYISLGVLNILYVFVVRNNLSIYFQLN